MGKINFNPVLASKKLLGFLDQRPRDVLEKRFGLNNNAPRTLESIGQEYSITRERVRQIEAFALNKIRQSEVFSSSSDFFREIKNLIDGRGGFVQEEEFLNSAVKKEDYKSFLLFLLVVGDDFNKIKEDDFFHHSWATDLERAELVKGALNKLHDQIDERTIFSEKELLNIFNEHLESLLEEKLEEEILLSFLKISRLLSSNNLGEWGNVSSSYIRPRGMKHYAFLVMRRNGSPMHFSEIARHIEELFNKKAHVQTVHNELIKDDQFVLVGRGLYALKEWGYEGGIVRNVIEKILKNSNPLSKDEIIKRVLKERYVKENTILVNLQNKNFFTKDEEGNYALL